MRRETRNDRSLWFAVAGGPLAWSIDSLVAVAIDHDYCAHGAAGAAASTLGATLPLIGIAVIAAAVTVGAGLTGWRQLRGAVDTGLGDDADDRRRFMARFGVVISILTLFGIVLRMIAVLFVSPATC